MVLGAKRKMKKKVNLLLQRKQRQERKQRRANQQVRNLSLSLCNFPWISEDIENAADIYEEIILAERGIYGNNYGTSMDRNH